MAPKKAAFKLHLGLDHDGLIPAFAQVSEGLGSEMEVADSFNLPKSSVLVFDRGSSRFGWHKQLTDKGLFWVTQARKGLLYDVIKTRPLLKGSAIIQDQIVRLSSQQARKAGLYDIRRIEYKDPESAKIWVFLTNQQN